MREATGEYENIWGLLSKRWNLRILKSLELKNTIRFNELRELIPGISANVLSERLDELEKFQLVKRTLLNEQSQYTGYLLNERCENLKKILTELDDWIFSQHKRHNSYDDDSNSVTSKQIVELLKSEITETELNFIKDKLFYSHGVKSSDLITDFQKLKDIIIELFGNERANQLITKLNVHLKSLNARF